MITVKFPPLHKGLISKQNEILDSDPRKGIIVLDGYALVHSNSFVLIVDLLEYLSAFLDNEEALDEAKEIIEYMNNKLFPADYWKELSVAANYSVLDNKLHIENPKFSKLLENQDSEYNMDNILDRIKDAANSDFSSSDLAGMSIHSVLKIQDALRPYVKEDYIILENKSNRLVPFYFKHTPWAFGVMTYVDAEFSFNELDSFVSSDEFEVLRKRFSEDLPAPPDSDTQDDSAVEGPIEI